MEMSTSSLGEFDLSCWTWLLLTHGFLLLECELCLLHAPKIIYLPVILLCITQAWLICMSDPVQSLTAWGNNVAWSAPSSIWHCLLDPGSLCRMHQLSLQYLLFQTYGLIVVTILLWWYLFEHYLLLWIDCLSCASLCQDHNWLASSLWHFHVLYIGTQ